jgi:hypothetical protein
MQILLRILNKFFLILGTGCWATSTKQQATSNKQLKKSESEVF